MTICRGRTKTGAQPLKLSKESLLRFVPGVVGRSVRLLYCFNVPSFQNFTALQTEQKRFLLICLLGNFHSTQHYIRIRTFASVCTRGYERKTNRIDNAACSVPMVCREFARSFDKNTITHDYDLKFL